MAAFHPTKSLLATSSSSDNNLRIWEIDQNLHTVAATAGKTYHYSNAKVVLVGEHSTGKTCLARALVGLPFRTSRVYTRHEHLGAKA